MSTTHIHGYAAKSMGQMLEPFTYEPPHLGDREVRVQVTHCGVCHTDIQAIDDFYELTAYPFVPGHEIVGCVSEVGSKVTSLKTGDRVGIGWQGRSCGKCEWCLKGEEQLCMEIADMGTWTPYGGFSSSAIADEHFAYPLPNGLASEIAAVLMCAGISVYTPLRRYASQKAVEIGVAGCGGLGHLAIQFAHALGHEVTVLSSTPEKREQALAFGADDFVVPGDLAELRKRYYKLDLLLVTATGQLPWERLQMTVKKEGRIALVSFPGMSMNPLELVSHNLSITGSFIGNRATMKEMLEFAHAHQITPMAEIMPMTKVNEAIKRVRQNQARYRIVLVNEAVGK